MLNFMKAEMRNDAGFAFSKGSDVQIANVFVPGSSRERISRTCVKAEAHMRILDDWVLPSLHVNTVWRPRLRICFSAQNGLRETARGLDRDCAGRRSHHGLEVLLSRCKTAKSRPYSLFVYGSSLRCARALSFEC